MPYCTSCGAKVPEGSAFCGSFGARLDNDPIPVPDPGEITVPGNKFNRQNVPTFDPPSDAPVFTPPSDAPVFAPPSDTPVFNPPSDTPVFNPPKAPKFTPPRREINGPVCHYHQDEPAVTRCARCGKYLCQDCFDSYGVSSGEYEGKALCYDCTQELVADNVAQLTKNKKKIKIQFIFSLIGIVLGFIFGMAMTSGNFGSMLVGGIIFAAIGGVFLSALKAFLSLTWEVIKITFSGNFGILTVFSLIWNIIVLIFKCIYYTISNTIYYIKYLKQTSGFIESDQAALRQMQDYMEYTMIRNQNRGVDIETLLRENSELADNTVAQMARTQTEEQIEASMRDCVASINENGEIIRSFRDTGKAAA